MTASLLAAHGVRHAVVSPGSRNAPLLEALTAPGSGLHCVEAVDERSAAFYALGLALTTGEPVALACTSGSAMLNYAPALAEAYYRHVPLIAVTADRPLQWIDQDDSQTIRQPGALANITKLTVDLPANSALEADGRWMANRMVNDALLTALTPPQGPVHINLRLDLAGPCAEMPFTGKARTIRRLAPRELWTREQITALAMALAGRRVLLVAGFMPPDDRLNRAVNSLAALPGVAVMTETLANLHGPRLLGRIDTLLAALTPQERREMAPDVVITIGGALVSRHVKEWLRGPCADHTDHWHVGHTLTTVDSLRRLALRIDSAPAPFLRQLAGALARIKGPCSGYANRWQILMRRAEARHNEFVDRAPWCDLRLFARLIPAIPRGWNVQLSNGTPVRYAQLNDCSRLHRCDCNRGVSGIDGSTSTALGAAAGAPAHPTLLVTGDLSARYDFGVLASGLVPPGFRMVVVNNSGGDIFRFIGATSAYDEPWREQWLSAAGEPEAPLRALALARGWQYMRADTETSFAKALRRLVHLPPTCPAVLEAVTPPEVNSRILKEYFNISQKQ